MLLNIRILFIQTYFCLCETFVCLYKTPEFPNVPTQSQNTFVPEANSSFTQRASVQKQRTRTGSFCVHTRLFLSCTRKILVVQRSLSQIMFASVWLAWLVAAPQVKEGVVSRLKIAGLHMRTRGIPACIYIALCFPLKLSSVISKPVLMQLPANPDLFFKNSKLKSGSFKGRMLW